MDPTLILSAIEAGVKLGQKVYDVLIDANRERPLILPLGDLYADVDFVKARKYFLRPENRHLTDEGGPYGDVSDDDLVKAYRTLLSIDDGLVGATGSMEEAKRIVTDLRAFEQYREGFGAQPAAKRLLGTVVEIGIDYFAAHPEAMGRDSPARKLVHAVLVEVQDADLAEGKPREILLEILGGALRALDANLSLVSDDRRIGSLLGGVTQGLIETVDALNSGAARQNLRAFIERTGSSILRGAATAFTENIDIFLRQDTTAKTLVKSTLSQVLEGIKGKEDLFTNEALELVFESALGAVGKNAALFTKDEFLKALIQRTIQAATNAQGRKLFSEEMVAAIVVAGLETVRDNAAVLIDASSPQRQLLANAVGAIARSLASSLSGGSSVADLLNRDQLVKVVGTVFNEISLHPEQLLGADPDDEKMTAVAQIIGSVARALGTDPLKLVNGDGFVDLVRIAFRVAVRNVDKLIDFGAPDTRRNVLFRVLQQVAVVAEEGLDPRGVVTREVFVEIVERVLPLVSANLELILGGKNDAVEQTVRRVLALSADVLENRTNGDNIPLLIEEILRRVLWEELDLDEPKSVETAARAVLRGAA